MTVGGEAAYTGVASNFLEPNPNVTDLALFGQDEIEFSQRLQGSVGIRFDMHRASFVETDLALNPKIGLVYHPFDRLSLRTSLSRGYRAPSVSEQFSSTTVFGFRIVPNLALRGESAWAGEIGATASPSDRVWLDAGVFWNEYSGLIEVAAAPDQIFTFQFQNFVEARVRGIDTGLRAGLVPDKLNVQTNYLFIDSVDLRTGRRLAYRSRHILTATLSGWDDAVALDVRYRSRPEEVLVYSRSTNAVLFHGGGPAAEFEGHGHGRADQGRQPASGRNTWTSRNGTRELRGASALPLPPASEFRAGCV